jgi:hypothetical protein
MVTAIVNGNGKTVRYNGKEVELLYLHFNKKEYGRNLPYRDGMQEPITLILKGTKYTGTLGARANYPYIYVATNLSDEQGTTHKLTTLLLSNGFEKGQRVNVSVHGSTLTVE